MKLLRASPSTGAYFQETESPRGDSLGSWLTMLCQDSLEGHAVQPTIFSNNTGKS